MFDFPKVIGQGSYGYIHYPHLLTTEDDEKEEKEEKEESEDFGPKVSKILEKKDAMDEMKKYKMFHDMDPECDFHLGEMVLAHPSEKNSEVLLKLDNGRHIIQHLSEYRLILMNYGGASVRDYANNVRRDFRRFPKEGPECKTHNNTESVVCFWSEGRMPSTTKSKERIALEGFWSETVRLVRGIERMLHHNMVHHDVKPSNVVYDNHRLNFIDFGLVNYMDNIYRFSLNNDYDFTIFFYNMPPELFLYNESRFEQWRSMSSEERKEQLAHFCVSWIKPKEDDEDEDVDEDKYSFSDSLHMSERELKYMADFEEYLDTLVTNQRKTAENCFNYCTTHDAIPDVFIDAPSPPPPPSISQREFSSIKPLRPLHDLMMEGFADFMMHDIDLYTNFHEFMYASMHTMDIYGLGHTLLYVLIRTYQHLPHTFVYEMYTLLREMLDNNLTRRINIQLLQERFSVVLQHLP